MNALLSLLVNASKQYSSHQALTMKVGYRTISLTYKETLISACKFYNYLQAQGIQKGDCVIICAPNSPAWVVIFIGCLLRGVVLVPLAPQNTQQLINKIVQQTEPKLFIGSRASKKNAGSLLHIAAENVFDLIADYSDTYDASAIPSLSDLALIMYTSGTTGDPKGVMLTHQNLSENLMALKKIVALSAHHDRFLSVLPLSHMLEVMIGLLLPYTSGCHIIYAHHHGAIGALLKQYKITKMIAIPELLRVVMLKLSSRFMQLKLGWFLHSYVSLCNRLPLKVRRIMSYPLRSMIAPQLHAVASGGAPLDQEVEHFWNGLGIEVMQGYGLTETSPVVATNTFGVHKISTVGQPLQNIQIKLADDGEILVKGPSIFVGYYKNTVATEATFTPDGYFKTGDIGSLDSQGFLAINGRKKYMLKGPGAQNIFPEDIEHELCKKPGVKDACVIGIERESGHVEIHAVLLLQGAVDAATVVKHANDHLESYQQIAQFSVWPEEDFPRTVTKKVKRDPVKKAVLEGKEQKETKQSQVSPLQQIIADIAGVDPEQVLDSTVLAKDLTFDSLMKVELITHVEQRFGVTLDEGAVHNQTTIADIKNMIHAHKKIIKPVVSRWQRSFFARIAGWIILAPLAFVCRWFFKINVQGAEHVSKAKLPFMLMPNHVTLLDGLLIAAALPHRLRYKMSFAAGYDVLSREYWYAAWFLKLVFNAFPFPRHETDQISTGLENIGTMLDEGNLVIVFPEGQLSPDGTLQPLKQGAGLLAVAMNTSIVPCAIIGAEKAVGYNKVIPLKRAAITVIFGPPVHYKSYEDMHAVTQSLYDRLKRLQAE